MNSFSDQNDSSNTLTNKPLITIFLDGPNVIFPSGTQSRIRVQYVKKGALILKALLKECIAKDEPVILAHLLPNMHILNNEEINFNHIHKIGLKAKITNVVSMEHNQNGLSIEMMIEPDTRLEIKKLIIDNLIMYTESVICKDMEGKHLYSLSDNEVSDMISLKKQILDTIKDINKMQVIPELTQLEHVLLDKGFYKNDNIIYFVAATQELQLPFELKLKILSSNNAIESYTDLLKHLVKKQQELKVELNINTKLKESFEKSQKELILKAKKEQIEKELGNEGADETSALEAQLNKLKLTADTKKVIMDDFKKFKSLPSNSPDYNVLKTYLDLVVALPWNILTKDNLDLKKAETALNSDHYGLLDVKQRILEFLAVSKLKNGFKGQILCLAGPPGVGKTSLAKSIAKTLGRKFVRISLGGVNSESEIRGHRRTYVGAMPGKIISQFKKAESSNPVMLLDEIDKLGRHGNSGDPSAALLEVLDPEQNNSFVDHYLNVPYDLSNVFFIATANDLSEIPAPLRDRMEIINLSSYTLTEKLHIAETHVVPKQLKEHSIPDNGIEIKKEALLDLIHNYTREAGVRDLQRKIGQVCRYNAAKFVKNKNEKVIIDSAAILSILGDAKMHHEMAMTKREIGVATGLGWTPSGGELLFIEATMMKGHGRLILTGSLGDVMKESANIAMSYIKASAKNFNLENFDFDHHDIHLHFPSGATPKDGPSAGITITTCLISLLANKTIDNSIAMTGEISLRGKVLPVGGIREKVIAAHRSGIKTVIMSEENRSSAKEIPEEVRNELNLVFVNNINEVIEKSINMNELNNDDVKIIPTNIIQDKGGAIV